MKLILQKTLGVLLYVALIAVIFQLRVRLTPLESQNSNFSFFWLAGRMVLNGENPYDETQYLAGHDTYGIEWRPNRIFPYPLPLAILCIPFGFFSMQDAYIYWQIISLIFVAVTIHLLMNRWQEAPQRRLIPTFLFFMAFFGPVYLTLITGAIGALSLLILAGAILLLENDKPIPAGFLLAMTMLKPPQGLPILLLAGIWFLARRDWKAIGGVALGGITLLVLGLIQDSHWISKFLGASEAVMDRTQGIHSNVWSFAYFACRGASPCSTLLGGTLSLILLGVAGFSLWKNQAKWSAWEAMNVIIPISFVSTIYLWNYDQIPYIIPILWTVMTLVRKTRRYFPPFVFLLLVDVVSLFAMAQVVLADTDLWSLGTSLVVLLFLFIAMRMKGKSAIDKVPAPA